MLKLPISISGWTIYGFTKRRNVNYLGERGHYCKIWDAKPSVPKWDACHRIAEAVPAWLEIGKLTRLWVFRVQSVPGKLSLSIGPDVFYPSHLCLMVLIMSLYVTASVNMCRYISLIGCPLYLRYISCVDISLLLSVHRYIYVTMSVVQKSLCSIHLCCLVFVRNTL